jgi:signal transduction histidine kinase
MYFFEISILIEAIFLSAALGYRLKLASQERNKYQLALLEETQKREVLAVHTADLLKKQLDIQEVQNRISKDLHDDVGSSLSSLQIYSALAAKYVDTDPNQAKKILEQITNNTSNIIENMGHIVWAMQPLEDQHQTIAFRIKNIGFNLLTIKNIACNYTFNDSIEALCKYPDLRKNIVLIFKEGINNIAKYSQALTAHISLTEKDGVLQISIEDDGIGFESTNLIGGNGLKNMQTRAKAMGGFTQITSSPGNGTSICCTIPLTTFSDIQSS